ncbi:MAG: glycosyltransferase family 4 protein [Gemmatimonadaceae bacterium]|nr:glycosyltransferase family 4 protein [Gemmatimonadaceae bacterium]
MSGNTLSVSRIPSAQQVADGVPRFFVPGVAGEPGWDEAVVAESEGGVDAEIRAFLDAQLETGDVLLDLNPGFGFVALSATTAPGGMPTVFVAGLPVDRLQRLQDVAADAGGWIETVDVTDAEALIAAIDSRLEPEGRVFVNVSTANVSWICRTLRPLIEAERLLAICIGDADRSTEWSSAASALDEHRLTPCLLAEQDGEAIILPNVGEPTTAIIALPASIAGNAPTVAASEDIDAVIAESSLQAESRDATDTSDLIFPTIVDADGGDARSVERDAVDASAAVQSRPLMSDDRWLATRDGLSLIAPHARTGYGIVGSHLLRALQARGLPIAFFPLGALDRGMIDNPQLEAGLRLQGAFRPDVPSVRLSQQFDLALHAGRGTRVGFTIFELDRFTDSERHQLAQQDALLVCSEWARQVCLDNGITDRPIHVVPLGVDRDIFNEQVAPSTTWTETTFLQVGKLETRKGQLELLLAFEAAFTPRDNVRLVLACGNPFRTAAEMDALLMPFRASPMASRISLLTNELPGQRDVAALMASADCGVFPSRAEGWNLEALEMLSMGKPVIATSCTAHNEYLTRDNARLIKIDGFESAVANGVALPGQWAAWGASQHEQLVTHLRDVHARKQQGSVPRNDAGIRTALRLQWQHSADELLRALDAIAS